MTKLVAIVRFLGSSVFWIHVIKAFMIVFVLSMIIMQIPELRYDMLRDPVVIRSADDLDPRLLDGTSYAKITGTPDFSRGFEYERYGLTFTYFTLEEYDQQIIVRTWEVDESWGGGPIELAGKLRPFDQQPFAYNIKDIYAEQNGVYPPVDAYYFAIGDVPAANGWQIGSITFATVLLVVMVYFFYLFRRDRQRKFFSDPLDYLSNDPAKPRSVTR